MSLLAGQRGGAPKYALAEVERRWLVADGAAIGLNACRARIIEDRYIDGTHLRLRRVTADDAPAIYKLGKKYLPRDGATQLIVNTYLDAEEFALLAALPAAISRKRRYDVAGGMLDVYETPRAGLRIFEREFTNAGAADAYTPPQCVGREITADASYSGHRLAQPN